MKRTRYEAILNSEDFPLFIDTIHEVEKLAYDRNNNEIQCKLRAFDENAIDWYLPSQIREIKKPKTRNWRKGEVVDIKIPNRKLEYGIDDGNCLFIWVRARIEKKIMHHRYLVSFRNWWDENSPNYAVVTDEKIK